jgi:hypothetical protein
MKRPITLLLLIGLAWLLSACGGEDTSQSNQADHGDAQLQTEAEAAPDRGPQDLQNAMDQISQMAQGLNNGEGKAVETINFRELKSMLPDAVDGMARSGNSGQTTKTMGINVSTAQADYQADDRRVKLSMTDIGGVQILMMSMAAWSAMEIDRESDTEMERTLNYEGFKAHQKYNFKRQRGEMTVLIGSRFIVQAEGQNVEMNVIEEALADIDFDALQEMAEETAQ